MNNCRCRPCRGAAAGPAAAGAVNNAVTSCPARAASEEPMCIHPSPLLAASTCPSLPPALLDRLDAQDEVLSRIFAAVRCIPPR